MAVPLPREGAEVRCHLIGMSTDTEALVSHHGGVVRIAYSRPSTAGGRARREHLVLEWAAGDPMLGQDLARLKPLVGQT